MMKQKGCVEECSVGKGSNYFQNVYHNQNYYTTTIIVMIAQKWNIGGILKKSVWVGYTLKGKIRLHLSSQFMCTDPHVGIG